MKTSSMVLWGAFFAFVAIAIATHNDVRLFEPSGVVGGIRLALGAVWIGFIAYSIECSRRENLFRTIGTMKGLYWGRQIGIDLYISVFLSIGLVYLVTGSALQTLLWSLAFIPFANLAILLFIILHLERILALASLSA